MNIIKVIGIASALGALLCATGYDCPECNFTAQTIATVSCAVVAVVCGMVYEKKGE